MNAPIRSRRNRGFTLVELLIVVIILAILAAIVVPSFGSSSEDAKVSTLKADLSALRNAIELYQVQHNSRYPGAFSETDGTTATATAPLAAAAFIAQLTQYSDANGQTSGTKSATFKYGPYVKNNQLPANPFLTGATADDVLADITVTDITTAPTASGATGWKFYVKTGRLVANDNLTLSDGTTQTVDF